MMREVHGSRVKSKLQRNQIVSEHEIAPLKAIMQIIKEKTKGYVLVIVIVAHIFLYRSRINFLSSFLITGKYGCL